MKKFLFFISLAALAAVGCNKTKHETGAYDLENSGRVPVTFSIENLTKGATKLSGPSTLEDNVDSAIVYVFDGGDLMEDFGILYKGQSDLTLNLKQGSKTAFVIVNPDDDFKYLYHGVQSMDDFNSLRSWMLETEDGATRFAMTGRKDFKVSATPTSVTIPLHRLAAKVQIDKITNMLPPTVGLVSVVGVFLTNAVTSADFVGVQDMDHWINKQGKRISDIEWFGEKDFCTTVYNGQSTPNDFCKCFYCAPNYTTKDSFDDEWCERHTRLVVQIEIKNGYYYYPIDLHEYDEKNMVQSNHFYHIKELILKHPGLSNPEGKIEFGSAGFNIEVEDWVEKEITREY